MKSGDLVKYRDRIDTDPHPEELIARGIERGRWNTLGVVIKTMKTTWPPDGLLEDSVEIIDEEGDFVVCKQSDLSVICDARC